MECCYTVLKTLADCLNTYHIAASTEAIYRSFYGHLQTANQHLNLTRIIEWEPFLYKHLWDSLTLLEVLPQTGRYACLDVGTGGGIPGIPLWIAHPDWTITLVDATGKKVKAVNRMIEALFQDFAPWLREPARCMQGRAEELAQQALYREQFDWVVARALAPLPVLLELTLPFLKPGGTLVAMKGPQMQSELQESWAVAPLLGGQYRTYKSLSLPDGSQRHLVVFDKCSPTPHLFPRKAGIPAHQPLSGQRH